MKVGFVLSEEESWVASRVARPLSLHWLCSFSSWSFVSPSVNMISWGPFPALTVCDSTLKLSLFMFLHCVLGKDVEGLINVKPDFWRLQFGCSDINWVLHFHDLPNPHISTQLLKPVDYGFKLNQHQVSAITSLRVLFLYQLQHSC